MDAGAGYASGLDDALPRSEPIRPARYRSSTAQRDKRRTHPRNRVVIDLAGSVANAHPLTHSQAYSDTPPPANKATDLNARAPARTASSRPPASVGRSRHPPCGYRRAAGVGPFLGLDPLYVANEGKVVVAVTPERAKAALEALRAHPLGREATIIGQVTEEHLSRVVLRTAFGARRILDMLVGEQLPRIC